MNFSLINWAVLFVIYLFIFLIINRVHQSVFPFHLISSFIYCFKFKKKINYLLFLLETAVMKAGHTYIEIVMLYIE